MATLTNGTFVVVADGEKALFLRNDGDEEYPNLVVLREIEHPNPPSREQGTDRPGRYPDAGTASHLSAVEETDWHRLEKERFAKELADRLYRLAHAHKFERLVIVAPPRVLGDLRPELHKEVVSRVAAEVAKDLVNQPIDRIETLLS